MDNLIIVEKYQIQGNLKFIFYAIILSLIIRVVLSLFRSFEISSKTYNNEGFIKYFLISLIGFHKDTAKADYLVPFLLGISELLIFPFLMKSGLWIGIAFWIGVKTVAQWESWNKNRPVFNRFLLGTALILIFSFTIMSNLVEIKLKSQQKDKCKSEIIKTEKIK